MSAGRTVPTRGVRLPRTQRRAQLLGVAREVFVANGYHATAMEDIAERAGVSKPVLYQHFPGKRDLYLALLEAHVDELDDAVRASLASTADNKTRVAACIEAYFAFVDRDGDPARLVFESDLTNDEAVRGRTELSMTTAAEAIGGVIREDTGLPAEQATLLGFALVAMAQVSARYWQSRRHVIPRDEASRLVSQLAWRGIGAFPKTDRSAAGEPSTVKGHRGS